MREILISTGVFIACLFMALISQIISPSVVDASNDTASFIDQGLRKQLNQEVVNKTIFELDPNEINPTLFAMTNNDSKVDSSPLGKPIESGKSYVTDSGLQVIDIILDCIGL